MNQYRRIDVLGMPSLFQKQFPEQFILGFIARAYGKVRVTDAFIEGHP